VSVFGSESVGPTTWAPLLSGRDRDEGLSTVREIREAVRSDRLEGDASLAGGLAGAALLHAYWALAFDEPEAGSEAATLLERSLEGVETLGEDPSLFTGLIGVGWILEHLADDLLDLGGEDPNADLEDQLARALEDELWQGHFDLVSGLAGMGVYAMQRTSGGRRSRTIELVVKRLLERADPRTGGAAWHTSLEWILLDDVRARFPEGYYNLGVSHGLAGVVSVLAQAEAAGVTEAGEAVRRSAGWLLDHRLADRSAGVFPSYVFPGVEPRPSRTAWCYGDPGVSAALLLASRLLGSDAWAEAALAAARPAALRPSGKVVVDDASLCHGAAGLAHLFNRLFHATGEPVFEDSSRRWLRATLSLVKEMDRPWFLEGLTGPGLVLLAACTEVEPAWDAVLAVSSPVERGSG
jgi:hypothetical protein